MGTRRRDSDRRFRKPPPGFVVLRESEIDPAHGREDRWSSRGVLDGRTIIRSGLRTEASATRAAWFVYDDACARGPVDVGDIGDLDSAVAEALARRFAVHREHDAPSCSPNSIERRLRLRQQWNARRPSKRVSWLSWMVGLSRRRSLNDGGN